MPHFCKSSALLLLGALLGPTSVFAAVNSLATAINNQELLRQEEREEWQRQQLEPVADVRLKAPAKEQVPPYPLHEQPCVPITHIVMAGDEAARFSFALKAVTTGPGNALGRCLGSEGLNGVLARVQNAIIDRGYVTTRVGLRQQSLQQGTLVLTAVPGRIGDIRFATTAQKHPRRNAVPAAPGEVLDLRVIEQALENFQRVPSIDAGIHIDTKALNNTSDLVIDYAPRFPLRLTLTADDSGSKATGKYQGGVTVSYDNPFALNDLFYVMLNHDLGSGGVRGTQGYTAHYSIPFGYWQVGATRSQFQYHQEVAWPQQNILYSGESQDNEVTLSRVIYRDDARKTTVGASGFARAAFNAVNDQIVKNQRKRTAGWGATLNHREYYGSLLWDTTLGYRRGTGALGALRAPEEAWGEGSTHFKIVTLNSSLQVPFSLGDQRVRWLEEWRAQWSRQPLLPQDRFGIGNRYTVRGFDGELILSADRGWLVRNELGLALGESGQELYVGVDYGQVGGPSCHTESATSANCLSAALAGQVLGLRGGYKDFHYDIFAGQPLKKPHYFKTAAFTAGFNLSWQL